MPKVCGGTGGSIGGNIKHKDVEQIKTLIGSGRRWIAYIFFSNYFYGLCAVALCIEASLQQDYPLNSIVFYLFIFCVTVLYYTRAYITEKKTGSSNPRSMWYWNNRRLVFASQLVLTVLALIYPVWLFSRNEGWIGQIPLFHWLMLIIFPASAAFYYGINHWRLAKYKLRNIGWLKPFIIGFVWAGLVTVYPFIFLVVEKQVVYRPDWISAFLFVKNFMFITVLCIMFDIKDYAADHNRQLKTFVVKAGLRKTIFFILIPLCVMGLASYIAYALVREFSIWRILLNTIPFVLLLMVAYSMHRRKSIFYYLIVIDGLMMVKALFGMLGMLF